MSASRTYVDALNGCFFLVYHNRVDVPSQNHGDRGFILALRRLAQIHHATTNACGAFSYQMFPGMAHKCNRPGKMRCKVAKVSFCRTSLAVSLESC